jgi:tripartite-type tricarboxylate transporter receptor subunit TctC
MARTVRKLGSDFRLSSCNTLVYKKLSFDPIKDLAPVSIVAESQTVLVVHE